jgi:hypothetical protein
MYAEAVTSGCLYMVQSFFQGGRSDAFYDNPPIAYGVVGTVPMGYMVVHEWVGKIITTQISNPFMLGSPAHTAVVKQLQQVEYQVIATLTALPLTLDRYRHVAWGASTTDGFFYKVLLADSFEEGKYYINASRVYQKYWRLCQEGGIPTCLLSHARMLYGSFAVAVQMARVNGEDLTDYHLTFEPVVWESVANALMWLCEHGLVYVDVRGPNVIRRRPTTGVHDVVLIDYDDCVICESPPTDYDAFYDIVDRKVFEMAHGVAPYQELKVLGMEDMRLNYLNRYPLVADAMRRLFGLRHRPSAATTAPHAAETAVDVVSAVLAANVVRGS